MPILALGGTSTAAAIVFIYIAYKALVRWLKTNILRLPFTYELRNTTQPLNPGARLIQLSRGKVCYQYNLPPADATPGPDSARQPLVLLLHGIVGCGCQLEFVAKTLAERYHRRVLRFDTYGRGQSSWDGTPQTVGLFTGQIAELLFALGENEPVDLVGWSLGGDIATHFFKLYPQHVRSLSLLSPATGDDGVNCRYHNHSYLVVPIRSFLVVYRHVPSACVQPLMSLLKAAWKLAIGSFDDPTSEAPRHYIEWKALRGAHEPGIVHAFIQTMMHYPLFEPCDKQFGGLWSRPLPIFVGWGARDTGASTHHGYARELFVALGGARHVPNDADRLQVLSGAAGAREKEPRVAVPSAHNRVFMWFKGSHMFPVEYWDAVTDALHSFWSTTTPRKLAWRSATAQDAQPLHGMIESAYYEADNSFIDYEKSNADGDKYTRTSQGAIEKAIAESSDVSSLMTRWRDEARKVRKRKDATSQPSLFLVGEAAEEAGAAGGAASIRACVHVHPGAVPGQADLNLLAVSKDAQRGGIGVEVLSMAEAAAINAGYASAKVHVVSTKPWLAEFYEKRGYGRAEETHPWPVPEFLREEYSDTFFHVLTKTFVEGG